MEESNTLLLNVPVIEPASSSVLPDPVRFVRAGALGWVLGAAGAEDPRKSVISRCA
jgi:hypothetical protein